MLTIFLAPSLKEIQQQYDNASGKPEYFSTGEKLLFTPQFRILADLETSEVLNKEATVFQRCSVKELEFFIYSPWGTFKNAYNQVQIYLAGKIQEFNELNDILGGETSRRYRQSYYISKIETIGGFSSLPF